jgi:hypothetical protein
MEESSEYLRHLREAFVCRVKQTTHTFKHHLLRTELCGFRTDDARTRGKKKEGKIGFSSYLGADASIRKTGFLAIGACVKAVCGSLTATIDEFFTLSRLLDEGPPPDQGLARPRHLWFCLTRVLLKHETVMVSSRK